MNNSVTKYYISKVQPTWAHFIAEHDNMREIAAIAIDTDIAMSWGGYTRVNLENGKNVDKSTFLVEFNVPPATYSYVKGTAHIQEVMQRALSAVVFNREIPYENFTGEIEDRPAEHFIFNYVVKLLDVDTDWKEVLRVKLLSRGLTNQGKVTSILFTRETKSPLEYNEMTFGSKSEIRIAQELEKRKVLFFPLPMAVRADTGRHFEDHREVDFLICNDGIWGVLEVSFHQGRWEKDQEKDLWFKKSGLLCVQSFTSEACYSTPDAVVSQFLDILAKHGR